MNEYVGNLHVHSTYSDGTGTVEEIARAANRAGLDFVGLTDHNTLAGLHEGKEKYYGKTLVLIGMEIGDEHNHYLAWRINREVPDNLDNPQVFIDAVKNKGGIGFIAHPFEVGCKYGFSGKAFTWDHWEVWGFTGICIWNFVSQWKGPLTSPWKAVYYFFNRRAAVTGPDSNTLAKWDEKSARGRVVAIGGTDAHAFRFGFGPIRPKIFSYRYLFKTINTHILTKEPLTGDVKEDKRLVYHALEKGHCFVSYDLLGSGRGFEFTGSTASQKVIMGDELNLAGGVKLSVRLPKAAQVRLIRDGLLWRESYGAFHMFTAKKPGVYRAEVLKKSAIGGLGGRLRPWIFSNPIYVRP